MLITYTSNSLQKRFFRYYVTAFSLYRFYYYGSNTLRVDKLAKYSIKLRQTFH